LLSQPEPFGVDKLQGIAARNQADVRPGKRHLGCHPAADRTRSDDAGLHRWAPEIIACIASTSTPICSSSVNARSLRLTGRSLSPVKRSLTLFLSRDREFVAKGRMKSGRRD
jgi:hypothetical protein